MHGKQNCFGLARDLRDFTGSVDTVQKRHDKVKHGYVGLKPPRQPDRVAAIRGLTDHVETLPLEESF